MNVNINFDLVYKRMANQYRAEFYNSIKKSLSISEEIVSSSLMDIILKGIPLRIDLCKI